MSKTVREITDELREVLKEKDEELVLEEGNICYDLTAPLAYVMSEFYTFLDNLEEKLSIDTAPIDILKLYAIPRIGEPRGATKTVLTVKGDQLNHDTWYYEENNEISFTKTSNESETTTLTSENVGVLPIKINGTLIASDDSSIKATIHKIITYGKDSETITQYRQRYIQSLTSDSEAGLSNYYESKIELHELVGVCGVDYSASKNGDVYVCAISPKREALSMDDMNKIKTYFTDEENETNIVPLGQTLSIETLSPTIINVRLTISLKPGQTLTVELLKSALEQYNSETFIHELIHSRTITGKLDNTTWRNYLVTELSSYGNVKDLFFNNTQSEILINKQYPVWGTVIIDGGA